MKKALWAVAVSLAMSGGMVWADESDSAALKAEIEVLKSRLARLENQVSSVGGGSSSIGDKPAAGLLELPSGLSGVQLSGYVDTAYNFNFNRPDTGSATSGRNVTSNNGRIFDRVANSFTIHAAELVLEKPLSDSSPIGFRTDLFFGDDAEQIHSAGLGEPPGGTNVADVFDLQQAYVTYRAPIGAGLDLKVGKFVTLLGAEVIESPANWNYSRSFLFGYAIPFTHTGALATYPIGEWGSTTWGLVNGWDRANENNSFKTVLGNITLTPVEGVTLATNLITGAERASDNRNDRTVLDLVATWQPIDKLTLMANYDNGHESNLLHGTTAGTLGPDAANWSGIALYAKYDLTDKWSLAGRWEQFNDPDNVRTGFASLGGTTPEDVHLSEFTLTSQWQLYTHLLARLEYRHDSSDERVFFSNNGGLTNSQDTVAAEVIYHF